MRGLNDFSLAFTSFTSAFKKKKHSNDSDSVCFHSDHWSADVGVKTPGESALLLLSNLSECVYKPQLSSF